MAKVIVPMGLIFLLVVGVVMFGGFLTASTVIPIDYDHADTHNHANAVPLLQQYETGVCDGKKVSYNIVKGQLIVSCKIAGDPGNCLMIIFRVTTNAGAEVLSVGNGASNVTAHIKPCWKVYKEDGYIDWSDVKMSIRDAITSAFGEP